MKAWIVTIAAALTLGTAGTCHAGSYSNDFSSSVGAAQLRGTAVLDSGSVRLTQNVGGEEGSLVIDNLDPGSVVVSFDVSFALAIGTGAPTADGVSLSFGPPPGGTYGESGAGSGLVVIFDTFDNGETPTPPSIRIVVNGTQVAGQAVALDSAGAFRTVTVHWDINGLDVNYNGGAAIFTDISTAGFTPNLTNQFTFGGRTGSFSSEQRIDDVSISTTATFISTASAPVPTLGEWAMIVMATLLAFMGAHYSRRRQA